MSRDAPLHDLVSGEEGDIKKNVSRTTPPPPPRNFSPHAEKEKRTRPRYYEDEP
jgi:hypothetical protein